MESDEGSPGSSVDTRHLTMFQLTVAHAFDFEDPRKLLEWARQILPKAFADVLDHPDPADAALADLPHVLKYLLRDRVARPKSGKHGMTLGGEEQAWHYRHDMRDAWMRSDGALEWLARRSSREARGKGETRGKEKHDGNESSALG